MGFLVQTLSRAGRVMDTYRFDKPNASIGRAFDSDVLLDDPYVDGHHVEIVNGLHGLQINVLTEQGRTEVDGRDSPPGTLPLASGAHLLLGKSHLRVLSTTHPVAPVKSLQRSDAIFAAWTRPYFVIGISALFVLLSGIDVYFSSFSEWAFSEWLFGTFTPLLGAAAWVAVAALITRVVRHDSRVLQHWIVVVLFLLSLMLWHYIEEIVRFNLGEHWVTATLSTGVLGLLLVGLFWLQMRIAFQQKAWIRLLMANTLAWGFIGYSMLGLQTFSSDFQAAPEFEAIILPEAMRLRGAVDDAEFLQNSNSLFEFSAEDLE